MLHMQEAGKETYSKQTLKNYMRTTHPKCIKTEEKQKKFLCRKKETNSFSHLLAVPRSPQGKVLKSEHPTEFGKISKREKNAAVIFKENGTNWILQFNRRTHATVDILQECHIDDHWSR